MPVVQMKVYLESWFRAHVSFRSRKSGPTQNLSKSTQVEVIEHLDINRQVQIVQCKNKTIDYESTAGWHYLEDHNYEPLAPSHAAATVMAVLCNCPLVLLAQLHY